MEDRWVVVLATCGSACLVSTELGLLTMAWVTPLRSAFGVRNWLGLDRSDSSKGIS